MTTVHAFALILDGQSRILLCRRTRDGQWNLPGGELDPGEAPWDAVAREVREETCLAVEATHVVGIYNVPKESGLVVTFNCAIQSGVAAPGDAVDKVEYFDLDELPQGMREYHNEWVRDVLVEGLVTRTQVQK